jgi:UDP-N-acetylglucosamine pyrophosphorylase
MAERDARDRFEALGLPFSPESTASSISTSSGASGSLADRMLTFDEAALERIGLHLYPKAAYGVLNGGSATTYADVKRNRSLDNGLFERYQDRFESLAAECDNKPKGITPAYINPDGTPGYSFLLLKLRMLLEHKKRYLERVGPLPEVILPSFQMTSVKTDKAIGEAFRDYVMSDELRPLAASLGCPSIDIYTKTQTMMAAISHSSEGSPRRVFDRAYGKSDSGLAIPGGHGQNFEILSPIYRKLYSQGIRYVWLGNIDNMGYTVDPVSLAIFALSGKEAAFEASWRTPMDVKGGIIVTDSAGNLTCADIGPNIPLADVFEFEKAGKPVLFNCAIGLFDLGRLIDRLDELPYRLPLRVTDQDKDAGRYAQAEQITWEIIGLLDDPMVFAVEKTRRFIAAKMLMETILTSMPPEGERAGAGLVAGDLHRGLIALFGSEYGLALDGGRWRLPPR